jgi:hypothetical protein
MTDLYTHRNRILELAIRLVSEGYGAWGGTGGELREAVKAYFEDYPEKAQGAELRRCLIANDLLSE